MDRITPNIRRAVALVLLLVLFGTCFMNNHLQAETPHHGMAAALLYPQLETVWGPRRENAPVGEVLLPGGPAAVRETVDFTIEHVPARRLPKLWLGGAAVLTLAAVCVPGSAVLWAAACLCSAAGVIALPLLVHVEYNVGYYRCAVQIDRQIEGTEHRASMTAAYRAYENLAPTDITGIQIDWDSAETVYTPQEAIFNDLSLLVQ